MREFNYFSEAFKHLVDLAGTNHVEIYSRIGMDKGQFSNIYNGVVKNPHASTRKKLLEFFDTTVTRVGHRWIINDPEMVNEVREFNAHNLYLSAQEKNEHMAQTVTQLKAVIDNFEHLQSTELDNTTLALALDGIQKKLTDILSEMSRN